MVAPVKPTLYGAKACPHGAVELPLFEGRPRCYDCGQLVEVVPCGCSRPLPRLRLSEAEMAQLMSDAHESLFGRRPASAGEFLGTAANPSRRR